MSVSNPEPRADAESGVEPLGDRRDRGIKPATGVRWTICALIFFATTVNYLDRQLFSLLVPYFQDDLKLGPIDLALINVSFILPYGFAMIFIGRYIDRVGTRNGLTTTYVIWNVASFGHALVRSIGGFLGARFLLGLGEAGMYPSGVKTMTEWFPRKERALATGIFNAGANCGAFLAPLIGVYIAEHYGWRECFLVTGAVGMIWLFFWRPLYRQPEEHPKISESELAYIHSDQEEKVPPISYPQLFGIRSVYALSIAKALSDAPWWFYLFWMPTFLVDQFRLTPVFMAWAIPVIYLIADIGSIAGGWLSCRFIQKGMATGPARKLTMLVCALAVTPVMTVGMLVDHAPLLGIPPVYWAVAIVSLAAGAHQGWSSNLFTLISDTVPKGSTAVAVGAINGFAMVGSAAMQLFVGRTVQLTSSYTIPFIVAGSLYLVALVVIHVMMPTVEMSPATKRANMPAVIAAALAVLAGLLFLQWETNRPPYTSIYDYQVKRAADVHSDAPAEQGPAANVGWMRAQWFLWRSAKGKPKLDLLKFDANNNPFVESKGDKATHYKGPSKADVAKGFGVTL